MSEKNVPGIDLTAFWSLTYGLCVVAARDGDRRNGALVNTVIQVAEEPDVVLALSLNKKNLTHDIIARTRKFAVQALDKDTPLEFIGIWGFRSGRDADKFVGVRYRDGVTGCPVVLDHTLVSLEAEVLDTVDCGGHTLFVGRVVQAEKLIEGEPLTYAYYHQVKRGRTGRNAPGYKASIAKEAESSAKRSEKMEKYVCAICGYVYDPANGDPDNGVEPGIAFSGLPADWVCPVCGAGKDQFEAV